MGLRNATDVVDGASRFGTPGAGPPLYTVMPSPLGEILLRSDGEALTGLYLEGSRGMPGGGAEGRADPGWFRRVTAELTAYFAGDLFRFETPLAPFGTPFQRAVWAALTEIPYGATWT